MGSLIAFLVAIQMVFLPILLLGSLAYPMIVDLYCLTVGYYFLIVGYHYSTADYHYLTVDYHYLTVDCLLIECLRLPFVVVFVFLIFLDNTGKTVGWLSVL